MPPASDPADDRPDPDRSGDRTAITAARIAAIAAVVAALIALIAAAIGAYIAGAFTLSSTDRQVAGAGSQAQAEFLLEQQQQAYADFIVKLADWRRAEEAYLDEAYSAMNAAPPGDPLNEPDDAFDERWRATRGVQAAAIAPHDALINSIANIRLVGSPEAIEQAEAIYAMDSDLREWIFGVESELGLEDVVREVFVEFDRSSNAREQALSDFQETARRDLSRVPGN